MDRSQPDTSTWSTATTPPGRSGTSSKRTVLAGDVVVVDDEPIDKHAFADWLADACGVRAAGEAVESGSDRER